MKLTRHITRDYLKANPWHIFVFGDNLFRRGFGGAAALRDMPNTYGFITKMAPNNDDSSFYRPKDYKPIFHHEIRALRTAIRAMPNMRFLISPIGSGLANKYHIWEHVILPGLELIAIDKNVEFLFEI